MSRRLAVVRQRLAGITPDLITPRQIEEASARGASDFVYGGASRVEGALFPYLPGALALCRQNPVLGTAYGLGALEGITGADLDREASARLTAAAQLVIGMGLAWWGYHFEALGWLHGLQRRLENDPTAALFHEWHMLVCRRRFEAIPDVFDQLVATANQLEALGYPHQAMQCRLDATSFVELIGHRAELLEDVRQYFRQKGNSGDEGVALMIRAYRDLVSEFSPHAYDLIELAEAGFERASMPAMLSYAWFMRGLYWYYRRDSEEARRWLHRAAEHSEGLRQAYYLTTILTALATLQWEEGDLPGCLGTRIQVKRLARTLRMVYLQADSNLLTGHILRRQGKYQAAASAYQRAQQQFRAMGHEVMAHVCQSNLGEVAARQGNLGKALHLIGGAITFFEQHEARLYDVLAMSHANLANTYGLFGYVEPAISHLRRAIDMLEGKDLPLQMIRPAIFLARLLAESGKFEEAHRILDVVDTKMLRTQRYDRALCLQTRGIAYRAGGQPEYARVTFLESLAVFEDLGLRAGAQESQLGLAETCQLLGEDEAAREILMALDRKRLSGGLRWRHALLRARRAATHGQSGQALKMYLSALRSMRHARRTLEREEQIEPFVLMRLQPLYDEAFEIAMSRGDILAGLALAEMHGSQLLSTRLGYTVSAINGSASQIEALRRRLTNRLGVRWTVVHYAWHREDIWAFTITPDGVEAHRARIDSMANADLDVATRPDISFREFVYLGRSLLQENAGRRSRAIRRKLMEVLIPDWVREGDDPNHMMIIIPANRLHGLAFQALLDGDTPLIEKTAVMYAPSLDLVQGMLARDEADTSLLRGRGLVCAQWQFEHPEYDPLPYAQVEAEAVCAAAGVTDVRIGEGFSREELQRAARSGALTGYDWLHFATHAYYDRATGAFTGLIAGSDVIGLEDIREWRLHAKVVTLSACQTGRGKWYYGDEIAGLTQAFLGAGAHTVVASQWLAHDQHSGELMADMYQKMRSGRSPAAALAEAQRGAHRRGVAAYYWAPFCAFGVM